MHFQDYELLSKTESSFAYMRLKRTTKHHLQIPPVYPVPAHLCYNPFMLDINVLKLKRIGKVNWSSRVVGNWKNLANRECGSRPGRWRGGGGGRWTNWHGPDLEEPTAPGRGRGPLGKIY